MMSLKRRWVFVATIGFLICIALSLATAVKAIWNDTCENPKGEPETLSWTAAEAGQKGTLVRQLDVVPGEIAWGGKGTS
jgi:hypothetical protein